jgi:hypothetical protein
MTAPTAMMASSTTPAMILFVVMAVVMRYMAGH